MRPVECEGNDLILRIQISIYQCENRHISPHLQRFGATTAQQKCTKKWLLWRRSRVFLAQVGFWGKDLRQEYPTPAPKGEERGGRDSAALRLRHLGAARGGPGNPFGIMQPSVLRTSCLFSLSVVRGASSPSAGQQKQPAACAAGCMVPKGLRRGRDSNSWYGMTRTSV